ncbi:V-type ATP synthase subunit D [Candidatus Peregrinibacteria bacterium]|nr:V-type ATP synthase subunit D [Candidatus Peregrinibacteria bacterium]
MTLLNVNPTRMALMDIKRRTKSAQRGHKLLKDKQDGLMQQFLLIIRSAKAIRARVEEGLGEAFRTFLVASAWLTDGQLDNALSSPQAKIELVVDIKSVMSVRIPFFKIQKSGTVKTYGLAGTNALLDKAVEAFDELFVVLIELAQIEKQAEALAIELETTRRRVNALEHKMIPDFKETVKYIKMKLDETERAGIVGIMRIKKQIEVAEGAA